MKTKSEVQKKRDDSHKEVKNIKTTSLDRMYFAGFYDACKWFLEPSEPKRTIKDLTEDELLELINISFDNQITEIESPKEVNTDDDLNWIRIDFYNCGDYPDGSSYEDRYSFIIDSKLDIAILNEDNKLCNTNNQAAIIDRLREMLAEGK